MVVGAVAAVGLQLSTWQLIWSWKLWREQHLRLMKSDEARHLMSKVQSELPLPAASLLLVSLVSSVWLPTPKSLT